jgi:thioredoxin 1
MAEVGDVTDKNFESEVLQAKLPVLVDFWAEWCGPCRAISPIIRDLAAQYGDKVKIVKMNVDENASTPAKYGVRAIPATMAFSEGRVVDQIVGARPKAAFEEMVKKLIA